MLFVRAKRDHEAKYWEKTRLWAWGQMGKLCQCECAVEWQRHRRAAKKEKLKSRPEAVSNKDST